MPKSRNRIVSIILIFALVFTLLPSSNIGNFLVANATGSISFDESLLDFGSADAGYSLVQAQYFQIENNGATATSNDDITLTGDISAFEYIIKGDTRTMTDKVPSIAGGGYMIIIMKPISGLTTSKTYTINFMYQGVKQLTATFKVNGTTPTPATIYGDVNGDGEVNTADITLLRRYVAGWDITINLAAADVNGDGEVNTADITLLRRCVAGWDITLGH